ncbi:MAG TPA: DUF5655 domain-containing protein [Kribbellaceae bacterium]|jgi:hypothetical protein
MARWQCPECGREFGNRNQAHVCAPGCTVDEVFAGRPPAQREVYDEILAHLESLGPVHVDAVTVGVFLKSDRKLAEVRPMARALSVELVMPRPLGSPRVAFQLRASATRVVHVVRLTSVEQVDDELLGWLTEAYDYATGEP